MKHSPRTRLMCGMCLRISNHHKIIEGSEEINGGMMRVSVQCKCGNKDQDCFTDSGNFESECTEYVSWEKEEELEKLKDEVRRLESAIEEANARWDYLWRSEEDTFY